MKSNILPFLFALISIGIVSAQTVELNPSYNTIGVKITNMGTADSCRIEYKPLKQSSWQLAYHPDKITISNIQQFRGSIFMLNENSSYQVRVTVYNGASGNVLPIVQTTTLASLQIIPTTNVKWVTPSGTGNYTQGNPGNLSTLFSSGQVKCGTTVMFNDGIYTTNGLQLTISSNCTESTPIILMAAPGANPIIDAGTVVTTPWTAHPNDPNLYSTNFNVLHSNICVLGNTALYPYPSVEAKVTLGNYNLRALNFGYDGFVRNNNTIWIKTQSGINPNDSIVRVSNGYRFLTVYGNNRNAYLKIQGIEFRHFGKPVLNPLGSDIESYSAIVFDLRNVHHVYFDNCRFLFNTSPISFTNTCNNFTIQNSYFKHDAGKWTHAMTKTSNVFYYDDSTSRARSVETSAIFIHIGKSGVLKNNIFDGVNSGIQSYIDKGQKEDIDIYDNTFVDNFDAIECDGLWTNLRVWNNEIIRPMAGISIAPPLIGPRYFYRNVFHGMQGRRNEQDDPYFIGCSPVNGNYMGQGIAIKTNSGYNGSLAPGNLYFFNNTFHAADTLGFVFTSWKAEWRKAVFMNNTYSHTISNPFFYYNLANNPINGNFQITSVNENYFSHNNSPIVKVKHIHGQYNCSDIDTVSNLQNTLSSISGSSNIFIQNSIQENPLFTSTNQGGFELSYTSALVDAGTIIQGFYDYSGTRPDIGAKESSITVGTSNAFTQSLDINVYPNPFNSLVKIHLQNEADNVSINVFNQLGQTVYTSHSQAGTLFEIDLRKQLNGIYFIEVITPSGRALKKMIKTSNTN